MLPYILKINDRQNVSNEPIAYLLVDRNEKYEHLKNAVSDASITIRYEWVNPKIRDKVYKGWFSGCYNRYFNMVSLLSSSLSSEGAVCLNLDGLEGNRIGTYFFNCIVDWALQWPGASVSNISLLADQAKLENNKLRRNCLYEQFGIKFDYTTEEKLSGCSLPTTMDQLNTVDTWKLNISEMELSEFCRLILKENKNLSQDLNFCKKSNVELVAENIEARKRPHSHALKALYSSFTGKYF